MSKANQIYELLQDSINDMTDYFLDNCPDDVNWEDFNPAIDAARSRVQDAVEILVSIPGYFSATESEANDER